MTKLSLNSNTERNLKGLCFERDEHYITCTSILKCSILNWIYDSLWCMTFHKGPFTTGAKPEATKYPCNRKI